MGIVTVPAVLEYLRITIEQPPNFAKKDRKKITASVLSAPGIIRILKFHGGVFLITR